MKTPVIIIHNGFHEYLNFTILNAIKSGNDVHFIGTVKPNIIEKNFNFHDINEYNSYCNNFKKIYEHLSTLNYDYELFCFFRWFILMDFMKKNNLSLCFYIDSDVLLYVDIDNEYYKFEQYEITLLHRSAASSSFFTKRGITEFCNFLTKTYSNKNSYEFNKIASHYHVRKKFNLPGGVCDMTLFDFYHYCDDCDGGPGRIGEMMTIINNSVYDHNINTSDNDYDFNGMTKNVKFINGIPHVFNNKLNKLIKFNALHFQGGSKYLMSQYYNL